MKLCSINDDLAWVDVLTGWVTTAIPQGYRLYDPEKYDLVPRESYKKKLAEKKQKEIKNLEEQRSQIESKIKELKSS